MERFPSRRVPFQRAALVFCLCLFASRQSLFAGASPVAIISDGGDSDAFCRVVGALCKTENMDGEAGGSSTEASSISSSSGSTSGHSSSSTSGHSSSSTSRSEGNSCRHFLNAYEVSSLLTREPQALAAVVTEVRGWIDGSRRGDKFSIKPGSLEPVWLQQKALRLDQKREGDVIIQTPKRIFIKEAT